MEYEMKISTGRVAGGAVAVGAVVAVVAGVYLFGTTAGSAAPAPSASAVSFVAPATGTTENGLAAEQEAAGAAAVAAQAEADRVAAEAAVAAQAEADRVAAEQAASEEATANRAAQEDAEQPIPVQESAQPPGDVIPAGAWPLPWIASSDPQAAQGGNWDFSGCPTSAYTFNGVPYCVP
jgi:hypothetical protein